MYVEPSNQLPVISVTVTVSATDPEVVDETTVACALVPVWVTLAPSVNVYWVVCGSNDNTCLGLIVWIGLLINLWRPPLPLPCGVLLRTTVPWSFVKLARYIVNLRSSYWSAVHVDAFCDLKRTPA